MAWLLKYAEYDNLPNNDPYIVVYRKGEPIYLPTIAVGKETYFDVSSLGEGDLIQAHGVYGLPIITGKISLITSKEIVVDKMNGHIFSLEIGV